MTPLDPEVAMIKVRVDGKTGMVGRVKWGVWDHIAEKWGRGGG
jgi:hypothetical protein